MQPVVTYGVGGGESADPVEPMFRHLRHYSADDRYAYIMGELEKLIDSGTLRLTDIFAQASYVRDAVGLALKGKVKDPETLTERAAEVYDEELRHKVLSHRVRIRVIDDRAQSIAFKLAVVPDPRGRTLSGTRAAGLTMDTMKAKIPLNVEKHVDYKSKDAMLPLPDAWVALGRHGAHCRTADSRRLQERYWLFEEVSLAAECKVDQPKRARV